MAQTQERIKRPDGGGTEVVRVVTDEPTPAVPRMSRRPPWWAGEPVAVVTAVAQPESAPVSALVAVEP